MSTFTETSSSIISFEEPDLLRYVTKPNVEMTLECNKENAEVIKSLVNGKRIFILFLSDATTTYTKESREYIDEELETLKIAQAMVATSLGHRILANFYARVRRRRHPVRVFATDWEAVEWINSLREKAVK